MRTDSDRIRWLYFTSLQLGLTDLIYCHECEKLCHRDDHNPNNRSHLCIQATGIVDLVYAQGDPDMGAPEKVFSLAFMNLQLLMSRYRSLCRESSQEHRLSEPRLTELLNNLRMVAYLGVEDTGRCVTSAKVVKDELIIRMETQIPLADPEVFGKIQLHLPQTCQHVPTRRDIFWPSNMDRWSQPKWEDMLVYQTHSGIPWRCAYCHTEYLATIQRVPESESYLVEVSLWKNLGSFKSSSDEKWQSHLSHGKVQKRLAYYQMYHGIIYHLFEFADKKDPLKAQASWLCKPPMMHELN